MCVCTEHDVTFLSCLVNVHVADTTHPLSVALNLSWTQKKKWGGKHRDFGNPFHTHAPACLHVHLDHGVLTSEALSRRSVINPPRGGTSGGQVTPTGRQGSTRPLWRPGILGQQRWIVSKFAGFPSRQL